MLPTDGRCARLSIGAAAAQLRLSACPPAAAADSKPADSAQPTASCLYRKIDSPVRSDGWPAVVGRGPPSLFRILTVHYCSTVAAICGLDRDYCARLLRNTYVAFRPSVYAVLSYAE
jgi:hypothetical protein